MISNDSKLVLKAINFIFLLMIFIFSCEMPVENNKPETKPNADISLEIISIIPAAGGNDIQPDTSFTITFNKDINPDTLEGNVVLAGNGVMVEADISILSSQSNIIKIIPSSLLQCGGQYTVTVSVGLRSEDGDSLSQNEVYQYNVVREGAPSMSVCTSSYDFINSGAYTNENLIVVVNAPFDPAMSGGVLSILWSLDGENWTEILGAVGETRLSSTISTVDGSHLRIKGRYFLDNIPHDTGEREYFIDKTGPEIVSCDAAIPGIVSLTFSEPIYSRSGYPDLPEVNDFNLSSTHAEITIESIIVDGDTVTLEYTYINSSGGELKVSSYIKDQAGNESTDSYCYATGLKLLRAPTGIDVISNELGQICVSGIQGVPEADSYMVAWPTPVNTTPTEWRTGQIGEAIIITGLDPETRYYIKAKAVLGSVGSSYAVSMISNHRNYIYPVPLFTHGSGTENDPWIINYRAELEAMLDLPEMRDDYFRLGSDIDLSRYEYNSVGYGLSYYYYFSGMLDGAGYALTGAVQDYYLAANSGIFYTLDSATVRNLAIKNSSFPNGSNGGTLAYRVIGNSTISGIAVSGLAVDGGQDVGGLIGNTNPGDGETVLIQRCFVQGSIAHARTYRNGGLVGQVRGNTIIEDCFTAVIFSEGTSRMTGGLVGTLGDNSVVRRCFASGDVDIDEKGAGLIGDISFFSSSERPVLTDSFAMMSEVGNDGNEPNVRVRFRVFYCYIYGTISDYIDVSNCFAYSDMLIDGVTVEDGNGRDGTGISLEAFKTTTSECFLNWDFNSVWEMELHGPLLRNMPLGGGRFGTPSIDPIPWD
jgi:hypothetical protein